MKLLPGVALVESAMIMLMLLDEVVLVMMYLLMSSAWACHWCCTGAEVASVVLGYRWIGYSIWSCVLVNSICTT